MATTNLGNVRAKGSLTVDNDFSVNGGIAPKIYKAAFVQSGANPPVEVVIANTLGGNVVWTRDSAGVYEATLAGAFTEDKTVIKVTPMTIDTATGALVYVFGKWIDANQVNLLSMIDDETPTELNNSVPTQLFIEIEVYA